MRHSIKVKRSLYDASNTNGERLSLRVEDANGTTTGTSETAKRQLQLEVKTVEEDHTIVDQWPKLQLQAWWNGPGENVWTRVYPR
ncbi:hypothetical protein PISMIDRAFT_11468 [Pisolithus microcarpus 441]|uniref:Uncharacterized protein n=1 Tax=Pisolithus microcarpus 441 TaxID=765257 RepID=A0A0C9YCS1_9AGAM|nr:hypothetical protein BKA83DRAFT_11468 [Pisolithus microcarpus]KIK22600.1 hypothetical protein PISMIDRAFT_11468 [Pisolithus microcarpus 441]